MPQVVPVDTKQAVIPNPVASPGVEVMPVNETLFEGSTDLVSLCAVISGPAVFRVKVVLES